MKSTLLPQEQETYPDRYRWTVTDCRQMAELGILKGKYEVIDGEVVIKMGQKPGHFFSMSLIAHWLNTIFGVTHVRIQGPIAVAEPDGANSEPEPDIVVTRTPATAFMRSHPGPADILFVAEVSDTTLRMDLLVKSRLYARAGIPEYWVLDVSARRLHVHSSPVDGQYAEVTILAEADAAALADHPSQSVTVADLLSPADA